MEIRIPITQQPEPQLKLISRRHQIGFGIYPALDVWGRYKKYLDVHLPDSKIAIPHDVQLGSGHMHLDDWFEPDQLVRHAAKEGIFELKMNVSDFQAHELQVWLNKATRVVTIEGRHDQQQVENQEIVNGVDDGGHSGCGVLRHRSASLHAHFRRSLTLSAQVLEFGIVCMLTPDGHHLVLRAPVIVMPPVLAALGARPRFATEHGRCANLVKCSSIVDERFTRV